MVALGSLAPGEQLPTVKALALQLTVNPNTVARAYRDLERERVIETSPGRGSFVRSDGTVADAKRAVSEVALAALSEAVREARSLGLERAELTALFAAALERWYQPIVEKEEGA
jgi:GntR family transcriptional regulator